MFNWICQLYFSLLTISSSLIPPSWWCWGSSLQLFLILNPVVRIRIWWINQLRNDLVIRLHNQDRSRILVLSTVICCRKHRYQRSTRKSLKPIHHAFVRPNDHAQIVLLQKLLHSVRTKLHDVTRLWWVSQMVWNDPQLTVRFSWIWPKNVQYNLRLLILDFVHYFQWSFNVFNIRQRL